MVTKKRFPPPDGARRSNVRATGARRGPSASHPSSTASRKILQAIGERVPAMRDDIGYYLSVQADRARAAASEFRTRLVTGILLTIAGTALLATATALLVVGAAGGVAAVLEGNVWLANLITGIAVLILVSSVRAVRTGIRRSGRMRRLKRRYERPEVGDRTGMETGVAHGRDHGE